MIFPRSSNATDLHPDVPMSIPKKLMSFYSYG